MTSRKTGAAVRGETDGRPQRLHAPLFLYQLRASSVVCRLDLRTIRTARRRLSPWSACQPSRGTPAPPGLLCCCCSCWCPRAGGQGFGSLQLISHFPGKSSFWGSLPGQGGLAEPLGWARSSQGAPAGAPKSRNPANWVRPSCLGINNKFDQTTRNLGARGRAGPRCPLFRSGAKIIRKWPANKTLGFAEWNIHYGTLA